MKEIKVALDSRFVKSGNYENEGHRRVGDMVVKYGVDVLVLVGDLARKIKLSKKLMKSALTILEVTSGVMAAKIVQSESNLEKVILS